MFFGKCNNSLCNGAHFPRGLAGVNFIVPIYKSTFIFDIGLVGLLCIIP